MKKKSKVLPARARMTWEEIGKIESTIRKNGNLENKDVLKLIKHVRFIEHLLAQEQANCEYNILKAIKEIIQ